LIITCPCALGLAVPAVQIVASGMLFRRGILVKDGSGLERMTGIDTVVFDKTGTLTTGELVLQGKIETTGEVAALALALSAASMHPLSKALHKTLYKTLAKSENPAMLISNIREVPGLGVKALWQDKPVRLGEISWCGGKTSDSDVDTNSIVALSIDGKVVTTYRFQDSLRQGAVQTVARLVERGVSVVVLSGDRAPAVADIAGKLGIAEFQARITPDGKVAFVESLVLQGKKVLMVGDGINDAPALAAATASIAPSSASDIGRTAADMVFTRRDLYAVIDALDVADGSTRHVRQNFAFAVVYNLIAVPMAIFGLATPLVAALAMSSSSIVVIANALRLNWIGSKEKMPETTIAGFPDKQRAAL